MVCMCVFFDILNACEISLGSISVWSCFVFHFFFFFVIYMHSRVQLIEGEMERAKKPKAKSNRTGLSSKAHQLYIQIRRAQPE